MDPEVLRRCIPGCEELEQIEADRYRARVRLVIGPVKATFKGEVRLENLNPPESYSIVGEGKGGVAGFAKGGADVKLTEDGDGTILTYEAKAQVGGKLAQLGSRLVDSTAKKMARDFFGAFSETVGGAPAGEDEAAVAEPAVAEEKKPEPAAPAPRAPEPGTPETGEQAQGLSFSGPMLWLMIGAAALILILAIAY